MTAKQLLNVSEAIALTINRLKVGVVSVYPITPQTKIVEKLAALHSEGAGKYEFIRTESEFAAASVALGAAAAGIRSYSTTSSQGLLMMLEVMYNIAGLRLPVVLTCANRSVSAPLNIWNDQQDAFTARDAGWLMFFAEDGQEAVGQHILAYKIAEKLKIPAMVNVDGFVLTHMSEPVALPETKLINKFLPALKPDPNNVLDAKKPKTLGHLVGPHDFFKFRQKLDSDLFSAKTLINQEYKKYQQLFKLNGPPPGLPLSKGEENSASLVNNGLLEYYGPAKAQTVFVALGSVVGTIKATVDEFNRRPLQLNKIAVLKIKTFRPFPAADIQTLLKNKKVIIINKAISAGALPPLSGEMAAALQNIKADLIHVVAGLGGQDITVQHLLKLATAKTSEKVIFLE